MFLVADSVREEADLLLVKAEVSSQVEQVHSQAHSATHKTPFHLPVSGGQSVDNVSSPEYNTRMRSYVVTQKEDQQIAAVTT